MSIHRFRVASSGRSTSAANGAAARPPAGGGESKVQIDLSAESDADEAEVPSATPRAAATVKRKPAQTVDLTSPPPKPEGATRVEKKVSPSLAKLIVAVEDQKKQQAKLELEEAQDKTLSMQEEQRRRREEKRRQREEEEQQRRQREDEKCESRRANVATDALRRFTAAATSSPKNKCPPLGGGTLLGRAGSQTTPRSGHDPPCIAALRRSVLAHS